MDMAASAIGRVVTPKHQSNWGIGGFLQDIARASQTLPDASVILGTESFEILGRFGVGRAEFHRAVSKGDDDHLPRKRMFGHVREGDHRAEMLHVRSGEVIGDGLRPFGDLRRDEPKAKPGLTAQFLDKNLLQVNRLPRWNVNRPCWRREPPRQQSGQASPAQQSA